MENVYFKIDFKDHQPNDEIEKYAKILKDKFHLSDFEALKIAVESQRNEFIYRAFMLSYDDAKYPTALESIAMALGMKTPFGKI